MSRLATILAVCALAAAGFAAAVIAAPSASAGKPVCPHKSASCRSGDVTASTATSTSTSISTSTSTTTTLSTSKSIYWGAYMDGDQTYAYLYGGSWGDAPWDTGTWSTFDAHAGKHVSLVHWGLGTPWAHDFNYFKSTFNLVQSAGDLNLVDMTTGSVALRDIIAGRYDASISTWMQEAAAWGHPFFLALDVEMNGTWEPYAPGVNGNTAADFVGAWRHMHDLADKAGATNITWAWVPNIDPYQRFTSYSSLYPGDAYVDWTGLDGFNQGGSSWMSFASLYSASYSRLLTIAPTKPIVITQVASEESGGSKAAWISDALGTQLPQNMPQVKAVVWFNWRIYENSRYWNWEIESSSSSQTAFALGIASPYYAPGGSFGLLPLGSKIKPL
jgi:Glycosyl hydrolase family 26